MKKYLLLFLFLYSISFAFNIGVAIDKNTNATTLISDSSILVTKPLISNNAILSFSPLEKIYVKYYRQNEVKVNGKVLSLPLTFSSKIGLISVDGIKYRNKLILIASKSAFTVINSLDSENYLSDVMMNFPQNLQLETYKALAVSLRSLLYSLKNLYKNDDYFITKNNRYFPYTGYSNPSENVLFALKATQNKVLFYKGNPVYAYYSYDCGGITASAEEVFGYNVGYLKSVPSPFGSDDSNYAQWSYYYDNTKLTSIFSHFIKGKVVRMSILSRTKSGRVAYLYIRTTVRSYKIKGNEIYNWVERKYVPSLVFSIYRHSNGYKFVGKGYGTGLGLPIYDANAFAQRGYTYIDILSHFYPNTELKTIK